MTTAKILIIDDNYAGVQAINFALELTGYTVIYARNGQDGIDSARKYRPSLILCDINMPGINGFEVLSILARYPDTKNIPVIFLTAIDEKQKVVEGLDNGADDYITKPYDIKEVVARIKRTLNRRTRHEPVLKQYGQLWISPGSRTAFIEGRKVYLSLIETLILNELMDHPNEVVTTEQLIRISLGVNEPTQNDRHILATHMYNLRHKKLRLESTRATYIHTEGHRGYRLVSHETGMELSPEDASYIINTQADKRKRK